MYTLGVIGHTIDIQNNIIGIHFPSEFTLFFMNHLGRVAGQTYTFLHSVCFPEWTAHQSALYLVPPEAYFPQTLDNSITSAGRVEAGLTRAVESAAVQEM